MQGVPSANKDVGSGVWGSKASDSDEREGGEDSKPQKGSRL